VFFLLDRFISWLTSGIERETGFGLPLKYEMTTLIADLLTKTEKLKLLTDFRLFTEGKNNNQTNGEKTNDINENMKHRYLQMKMWNQSLNDV
jgi:hypothetical protein